MAGLEPATDVVSSAFTEKGLVAGEGAVTSGRRNILLYQLSYGVRGLRQGSNLRHKWSISCIHRKYLKKTEHQKE